MSLIVGIAGTAKNTGKTTTTSAILDELYNMEIPIGLTSIGYDGEEIDNITRLPKPRLFVRKNTILATAQKCLMGGSAKYEVLETTDIKTPLGNINIVRIVEEGLAVVAGPNKGSQLKYVAKKMVEDLGCKIVLVDGALNRIAPMIETDGIIVATGAARNVNIESLVRETKALYEILDLPEVPEEDIHNFSQSDKIVLYPKNPKEEKRELNYGSLIDESTVKEIIGAIEDTKVIFIPALIAENSLKRLNDSLGKLWADKTLVINEPIKLLTGGNPESLLEEVNRIRLRGGSVTTLRKLPLLAITVNPFYPKYRFEKDTYEPGYVDKNELQEKMRGAVKVPVINIRQEGAAALLKVLFDQLEKIN